MSKIWVRTANGRNPFTSFGDGVTIGGDPVQVSDTATIRSRISGGHLEEVKAEDAKKAIAAKKAATAETAKEVKKGPGRPPKAAAAKEENPDEPKKPE